MHFDVAPHAAALTDPLPGEPLGTLQSWFAEARERRVQPNPDAMAVATVAADGRPSLRMVLCRGFDAERGHLVFFTNRESRKGNELEACPQAAATFHWDALERQARLEGPVAVSPVEESDRYFASRPRGAQIAAWASAQSRAIASRAALLAEIARMEERFGGGEVPRPPHWGGYRLTFERVELWVGSTDRAHDRGLWQRTLEPAAGGFRASPWRAARLQP